MAAMELSGRAQRVLGALVEKAMATPDGYPLSLNALRNACNQKTARDPVTNYLDEDVSAGIAELKEHGLVLTRYSPGSRVPKYAHLLHEKLDLHDGQVAILGVLLLRGPQTVGEVKGRTGRMHDFAALGEVEELLAGLTDHKFHGALVEELERQPGQKEVRWRHVLGPDQTAAAGPSGAAAPAGPDPAVEAELEQLRAEVADLRQQLAAATAEANELRATLDELTAP